MSCQMVSSHQLVNIVAKEKCLNLFKRGHEQLKRSWNFDPCSMGLTKSSTSQVHRIDLHENVLTYTSITNILSEENFANISKCHHEKIAPKLKLWILFNGTHRSKYEQNSQTCYAWASSDIHKYRRQMLFLCKSHWSLCPMVFLTVPVSTRCRSGIPFVCFHTHCKLPELVIHLVLHIHRTSCPLANHTTCRVASKLALTACWCTRWLGRCSSLRCTKSERVCYVPDSLPPSCELGPSVSKAGLLGG